VTRFPRNQRARSAAMLGARWRSGDPRLLGAALRWSRSVVAARLLRKYRRSLSADEADELAAIAVEAGWESRAAFDERKGTLRGWIWTIADHQAQNLSESGGIFIAIAPHRPTATGSINCQIRTRRLEWNASLRDLPLFRPK